MSKIKTDNEREITKKKSSIPLGSGTIIIAKIEKIKKTTPKSFDLKKGSKKGAILNSRSFSFFAKKHL